MHKKFVCSDHHFGHENILTFTGDDGKLTRPGFKSIEEHDELIIENHNKIVRPVDRVYLLGDVAIRRKAINIVSKLNGKLVLCRGNHDLFKLKDYIPYFEDIRAYKIFSKYGIICSHIPIHPNYFKGRWKLNIHGHLHQRTLDDDRYLNVSMEQTYYKPIDLDKIIDKFKLEEIK